MSVHKSCNKEFPNQIQSCGQTYNDSDHLNIWNGPKTRTRYLLGIFCGELINPPTVTSSMNQIMFFFESNDDEIQKKGFEAYFQLGNYDTLLCHNLNINCSWERWIIYFFDKIFGTPAFILLSYVISENSICGGEILVGTKEYLNSPIHTTSYPTSIECVWTLIAPKGKQIYLELTSSKVIPISYIIMTYPFVSKL